MTRRLLIAVLALLPALAHAQPTPRYAGLPLAEVLKVLQAKGLRIVFSSDTVTPAMRVVAEPKEQHDRARLDELLAPHGLRVRGGPGGTLVIVRAATPRQRPRPAPRTLTPARENGPQETQYRERVTVEGTLDTRAEPGVSSHAGLTRAEIVGLGGALTDDPVRAAQGLPHAAATDDFRSDLSVRGSPYRHVGVVIDGVATRRLQHTAYGRGDTGSLSMLHGDLVERVTLRAGAYPQHVAATLGGQLTIDLREGSREGGAFHVAFSTSSATAVAEGPVGAAARGSWLVSARQSYRDWPTRGFREFDGTMFGFTDALAKVVYDVRPRHQVALSVFGGRSHIDEVDGGAASQPGDGLNRTAVVNFSVRSTLGSRSVVSQRVYVVAHGFLNETEAGHSYSDGHEEELAYRADLARAVHAGVLQAGAQVQRVRGDRSSAWLGSAYAQYRWRPAARLTLTPGLRIDRSTLTRVYPAGRWLLGELALDSRWILTASAGVSHQLPQLDHVAGLADPTALAPERAATADVGVSRSSGALRWHATLYVRRERDLLGEPRAPGDVWRNAFTGSSHGVELMVERRNPTGLRGWAAYSFGQTRYTDVARGESFWADFDQRHAVNVHAAYGWSSRSSVSATFRSGTNFPIPAFLEARDGALYAGVGRNEVRLRPYARLDLRGSRSFAPAGRRLTVYAEVVNVLNRTNIGLANGRFAATGEAIGFTERLIPRLPAAGITVEF